MKVGAKIMVIYIVFSMGCGISGTVFAQGGQRQISQLVEWLEIAPTNNRSNFSKIREMLKGVTTLTVRVTSPDIPLEKRRLWIMPINGGRPKLISHHTGVRNPKWGRMNWIAYEQEFDANGDGVINFHDGLRINIINVDTGLIRTIGEGVTPVWSPDGKALAFIRKGEIWTYKLSGRLLPMAQAQLKGDLVYFDKHSKALADKFWMINLTHGSVRQLPKDLRRNYLWLGALSSDGQRLLMSDASHSDIFLKELYSNSLPINITNDDCVELEPDWSSDEKSVVFVSDRPIE